MSTKQHFFMIAGTIGINFQNEVDGVKQDNPSTVPANAIVRHDDTNFPAHRLGRAQQNLAKAFLIKVPEEAKPNLSIVDIVVTNVSYLGHMTEEEFHAPAPDIAAPAVREAI